MATCGDGIGPEQPLGARSIYWDPIELPSRQHYPGRARRRLVGHRARIDAIDVDMLQAEVRQHNGAYVHATAAVQSAIRATQ